MDRGSVEIVLSDSESVINEDNLTNENRKKNFKRQSFIKKVDK